MSNLSFDRDRLEELLLASANEAFSVDERNELNALLLKNAAARSFAVQFLSLDSALAESLGASEAALLYTTNSGAAKNEKRLDKILRFPLRHKAWLAVAAAAVVIMGVWGQSWRTGRVDHASVIEPVGFVQSAMHVTGFKSGDTFKPGDWVRFEKGRVVVKFESGAKLAVEGPADFQIVSNNAAQMIRGRATVRVPGKIKGFTLDTPTEQIVDLGTSFGVKIEDTGATSIAVFEGSVELRGQQNASGPQQISAGQSVRVAGSSNTPSEIPYDVSDYLPTWQTSFGMEALEGEMRIAEPNERAVPGKVVDGDRLLIFPERESVQLPVGFVVSANRPGAYDIPKGLKQQVSLSAPVVVDSYLIQFNPGQSMTSESPHRFRVYPISSGPPCRT